MRRLLLALVPFFLLTLPVNAQPEKNALEPQTVFECGEYEIKGMLKRSDNLTTWIEVLPGTAKRINVPLAQISGDDTLARLGKLIQVKALVFKSGDLSRAMFRVLTPPVFTYPDQINNNPIRLLKSKRCEAISSDETTTRILRVKSH